MSWPKQRLDRLCRIEKGVTGIQKAIPGPFPLVVTSEERKSHNEYQFDGDAVVIPLVSSTGHGHRSLKRIHFQQGKFAVGSILCAVMPKDTAVLSTEYLYRFLDANRERELVSRMKGMANVSLPVKAIGEIEIPVPPLEVQLQAIEKSKKVEALGNQLDTELTHQLSLVAQLRQAFLREAMQGRLVPQVPDVPPATELLHQIKAEKERLIQAGQLKKQKPLPPIKEEEIPFEIPENWVWCRLGEVVLETEAGKSPNCENIPVSGSSWGVIKTTAVQEMVFLEDENKVLPAGFMVSKNHIIHLNDLLITRAGPKNRVGIVCCVQQISKNLILSDKTIRIKTSKAINPVFIGYLLNSPMLRTFMEPKMVGMADSQVNISQDNLKGVSIPLPPLPEQHRIVAKLDALMQHCDALEASIKAGQQQNALLLQQVLREALEPK